MQNLFELTIKDNKKLTMFLKHCESLLSHSDTALFKVRKKGIFLTLTDFEGLSACETRFCMATDPSFKLCGDVFSAKIFLESLISVLRQASRLKRHLVLFSESQGMLKSRELGFETKEVVIDSLEHRLRDYFIISTQRFESKAEHFGSFIMNNQELCYTISKLAILSGISGGIGTLRLEPCADQVCRIHFGIQSNGGSKGSLIIDATNESETVKIVKFPKVNFEIFYALAYLKRFQSFLGNSYDNTTVMVSNKGIVLQTDMVENVRSLVYVPSVDNVELFQDAFS